MGGHFVKYLTRENYELIKIGRRLIGRASDSCAINIKHTPEAFAFPPKSRFHVHTSSGLNSQEAPRGILEGPHSREGEGELARQHVLSAPRLRLSACPAPCLGLAKKISSPKLGD